MNQYIALLLFLHSCLQQQPVLLLQFDDIYEVRNKVIVRRDEWTLSGDQQLNTTRPFMCLMQCSRLQASCWSVIYVKQGYCLLLSNQIGNNTRLEESVNSKVYFKTIRNANYNESCIINKCNTTQNLICGNEWLCTCNSTISYWNSTANQCVNHARNCHELYQRNNTKNGDYTIYPNGFTPTTAYCSMQNEGWTLISEQKEGIVRAFYRSWSDYEIGFGFNRSSYFIGLANIHHLTSYVKMSLKVDLSNNATREAYTIVYDVFNISSSKERYKFYVSETISSGNVTNVLYRLNGAQFSTYDRYYDRVTFKCVQDCSAGWWYKACYLASAALTCQNVNWAQWYIDPNGYGPGDRRSYRRFAGFRMMIKPLSP